MRNTRCSAAMCCRVSLVGIVREHSGCIDWILKESMSPVCGIVGTMPVFLTPYCGAGMVNNFIMYCKNCGSEINNNAVVCVKCGVKAGTGNRFCPSCGAPSNPDAVVCVKCGCSLGKAPSASDPVDSFGGAIAACFKKYATFSGRANRSEYWWWWLFTFLFGMIPVVNLFSWLVTLIPSLAVLVRRLHDTGRSGFWFFITLIPIVGAIWLLVLLCQRSQEGDNEYGANPN